MPAALTATAKAAMADLLDSDPGQAVVVAVEISLAALARNLHHEQRERIALDFGRLEGNSIRQSLSELAARALEETRDDG